MIGTIVGGMGSLFGLAVWIGWLADRQARSDAWQRVATARRILHEKQSELEEQALALVGERNDLDLRDRRVEFRESVLFEREMLVERFEREQRSCTRPDLTA